MKLKRNILHTEWLWKVLY